MKHYAIVQLHLQDFGWQADYLKGVTPLLQRSGARVLCRTPQVKLLEGSDRPDAVVVIEFPSLEAAREFYEGEQYRPFKLARQRGADTQMLLVPAEDIADHDTGNPSKTA